MRSAPIAGIILPKVNKFLAEFPAFFFLPYLLLYLVAWVTRIPTEILATGFWGLHILIAAYCIYLVGYFSKEIKFFEWAFGIGLFWFLFNRGAYLEYPSDPWEHFRRLTLWNSYPLIDEHPNKARFLYFWGWTFLRHFPILDQRLFLDFYGAFWQWLLTYQFARFYLRFGISRERLFPFVIGSIVLVGSGMMNFRYYMLSPVPLGYLAFLSALVLTDQFFTHRAPKLLVGVVALFCLMVFCHPETALFYLIGTGTLVLCRWKVVLNPNPRVFALAAFLALLSLAYGHMLYRQGWFPYNEYFSHQIWKAQLSKWGTFRLWDLKSRFFETLAVPGLIALALSPLLYRKQTKFFWWSWLPVLILLFPPTVQAIVYGFSVDTPYRVLFAFPLATMMVLLLETLTERLVKRKVWVPTLTTLLVLLVAAPYAYPWRGRLFFSLHRPKKERILKHLDVTAEWFRNNRSEVGNQCRILSDDLSLFSLYSHMGWRKNEFDRVNPYFFLSEKNFSLEVMLQKPSIKMGESLICGVLVADWEKIPPPAYSIVSIEGKLWPPQRGDLREHVGKKSAAIAEKLLHHGWKVREVPPFYRYYEPTLE